MKFFSKRNFNTITSDERIILNFLSFIGVPNIQTYQSKNCFPKLRKILQYTFFIYFLCVFMLQKIYRVNKYFSVSTNIVIQINVISTAVLSLLLKVFFIINIKKLNSVGQCFWEFMLEYQVIYMPIKRIVTTGCFASFIFPILIYLCHTFIGVPTEFYDWIVIHCFFFNKTLKIIMYCFLDIGCAINEYTFPLIITILLSFLYISFCKFSLKPFADQLKLTRENPTSQNISKCLDMNTEVRRVWLKVEDFSAINAFLLYGLSFTNALYLIGKYAVKYKGFTTLSKIRALSVIFQMSILAASGSSVISEWQEIKILAQELPHFYGKFYDKIQSKDMLYLWSLADVTKIDICFTCFNVLKLDCSLLLKTIMYLVTFGVLMI